MEFLHGRFTSITPVPRRNFNGRIPSSTIHFVTVQTVVPLVYVPVSVSFEATSFPGSILYPLFRLPLLSRVAKQNSPLFPPGYLTVRVFIGTGTLAWNLRVDVFGNEFRTTELSIHTEILTFSRGSMVLRATRFPLLR